MSGVPTPVNIVVEPWASASTVLDPTAPGGVTLPIPLDDPGTVVGQASFELGFPAATMVDVESEGGVPAFGQDFNGIFYTMTAYLAMLQAGQICTFNAAAAAAFTGYKVGAVLASVAVPGRTWTNLVDENAVDPDDDDSGWFANDPLHATLNPAAGTLNNLALPGASDYALDIDTTAGNVDITGLIAQRNGQTLYISNTGPNLLQLMSNNAGSDADNQIRAATDLAVITEQTFTVKYFAGLDRWLAI